MSFNTQCLLKSGRFLIAMIVALHWLAVAELQAKTKDERLRAAMLRVRVTSQSYDFFRPWKKHRPVSKEGIGIILAGQRILVTAALVENATYIELETINENKKCPALVVQVDYASNLALLRPQDDPCFPVPNKAAVISSRSPKVGDTMMVGQFEANGMPITTKAEHKGIEVQRYPYGDSALLAYRLKVILAKNGPRFTLPVFRRGELVGLMMHYDPADQMMTVIPGPVIDHFLLDLADGHYDGFPRAGFSFAKLEDPQLRRYVGLKDDQKGVYVDKVRPGGAAQAGGLRSGDVILAIDGFPIDNLGQYEDPDFGRLSVAHLTTTRSFSGDRRPFRILRDDKEMTLNIVLKTLKAEDHIIPPYVIDQAPEYVLMGGLVFQELSRRYLEQWGANWQNTAPLRLRYYDRYQWDLFEPGKKLVILSQVLNSDVNVGYEQLRYVVVTRINDRDIHSLYDVAVAELKPLDGFHKIEFEEDPKVIYLDAATAQVEDQIIRRRYGLPDAEVRPAP